MGREGMAEKENAERTVPFSHRRNPFYGRRKEAFRAFFLFLSPVTKFFYMHSSFSLVRAFLLLAAFLLVFPAHLAAQNAPSAGPVLLPRPRSAVMRGGTFRVPQKMSVRTNLKHGAAAELRSEVEDVFPEACKKFSSLKAAPSTGALTLRLVPSCGEPAAGESYRLTVSADGIDVEASAATGLFYALQTLRQLRLADGRLALCTVDDGPRYGWRGVMLDVSRHFFDIAFLKKQIDALARYKMNRLHLHLTDQPGWRMAVKGYPRLTALAAWRPQASFSEWRAAGARYGKDSLGMAYGGFYTARELKDLVAYAKRKNVTLVPEIEMPAHSMETTTAYPALSCSGRPYADDDLCPGREETYTFVEKVLRQVAEVFPSQYLHVGGDEAARRAWAECPACRAVMRREHLTGVDQLQSYFMNRVAAIVKKLGRKMLGWDEVMQGGSLPAGTAVMVWHGGHEAQQALRQGYDVVLSPAGWCYLDGVQDAPHTQPRGFGGYRPLAKVYSFNPDSVTGGTGRVLGVQGNLWTEYVGTPAHAEYMLYPRALALAEKGWTGATGSYGDFRRRALACVDTLRRLGYNAFNLATEVGPRPEWLTPVGALSVGCRVTYAAGWNPYYPAAGAKTLTDGLRGDWTYGDGRWQGFIGNRPLDVTVDLGREVCIHNARAQFMQVGSAEIFFPATLVWQTSTDGKNFTTLKEERPGADAAEYGFRTHGWQGEVRARYVRLAARSGEKGGWLFTDEIIID